MNENTRFPLPGRFLIGLVIPVLSLVASTPRGLTQIVTLTDANSVVQINTGSSAGMFSWFVDGTNHLAQQSYWYRVGPNGPEAPINAISAPTITTPDPRTLYARYFNGSYGVEVDYALEGSNSGSGESYVYQTIILTNSTAGPLNFHFYQYSDFDFSAGQDYAQLNTNQLGRVTGARLINGGVSGVDVVVPTADHGEAALFPFTINRLIDGSPTTLNGSANAGPGDATLALEWDVTVDPFGLLLIALTNQFLVPPKITTPPASQNIYIGNTANFLVAAGGTKPLSYQWRRAGTNLVNGASISGANSANLIISPGMPADAANYTVVVTNSFAAVTSAPVALTVISELFVVNNNDTGPGSLRQAILNVPVYGLHTINFASNVTGLITLTGGELAIHSDIAISGPGAKVLSVSGNSASRVFNVTNGNVAIAGLSIRDGLRRGAGNGADGLGGGVFNSAALILSNCAVMANVAIGSNGVNTANGNGGVGGNGFGGGIYNTGTLALVNCTLTQNEARGATGGRGADRNTDTGFNGGAGGQGLGGAVCNDSVLAITNCTFSTNRVSGGSGGAGGEGALAPGRGGGGGNAEGAAALNRQTCLLANVTLVGSVAERGPGGSGAPAGTTGVARGGGVRAAAGTTYMLDTLVALNGLGSGAQSSNGVDVFGPLTSEGFNLIGAIDGSSGITNGVNHDQAGVAGTPINPLIGVLSDNGGPTLTYALLTGSPAIDKGGNGGATIDQRGRARPFDFSFVPNAAAGNGSDIGAFEVNPPVLNVARASGNVMLSWATNETGYTLEANTDLNTTGWSTVSPAPVVSGANVVVTNAATGPARFYRLRK